MELPKNRYSGYDTAPESAGMNNEDLKILLAKQAADKQAAAQKAKWERMGQLGADGMVHFPKESGIPPRAPFKGEQGYKEPPPPEAVKPSGNGSATDTGAAGDYEAAQAAQAARAAKHADYGMGEGAAQTGAAQAAARIPPNGGPGINNPNSGQKFSQSIIDAATAGPGNSATATGAAGDFEAFEASLSPSQKSALEQYYTRK